MVFFGDFPIARMREKKKAQKAVEWATAPFACVESRYNGVYRDTGPGGAAQHTTGAQGTRPRYSRDRPRHGRLGYDTTYAAGLRAGRAAERTRMALLGVSRDTKHCIMAKGRPLCRNTVRQGCDTAPRHGSNMLRHGLRYGWACARHGAQCACGTD